ncbi:DUF2147 domain-containing protein [Pontixanthobacter aestiaquae]|uniref:DUF2147 domain-containing protein n=1 Tax=Pontixanthobacter aestiaquae TaxID=1509367 RepID=A0A844Z317_9SPHN|nr:DUF2147 domain-containing protein [Pontixanthobacter aestiaquae]MDN3645915.1 DUF2147 domain-containing protein [Pontixanthobacter aestiaquae]MXO83091.1 DUF2147 domain-containing protein [Pontixanthobacter aestiaquae]
MTLARSLLPAIAAFAFATPAQAAPASIAGNWKTDDGKSVIQFYKCGSSMCGKISKFLVAEPKGGARDTENPDKAKRDRKLLGLPIFWSLKPGGERFKGQGYSPEDGRYFNAQVWRSGSILKVRGCVAVFCKTVNFTRA